MALMKDLLTQINKYLPLFISEVHIHRNGIQLVGVDWVCTLNCAWRLSEDRRVIFACYDRKADENIIVALKGLSIIGVSEQSNILDLDPVFILSNGQILEVFSNDIIQTWTFRVSDQLSISASPIHADLRVEQSL